MLPLLLAAVALAGSPASRAAPGIVDVRAGRAVGSGVVWSARARTVLTALHVVEASATGEVEVVLPDRTAAAARVVDRDPGLDLALLEVAVDLDAGPAHGASTALAPGDPVSLPGSGGGAAVARGSVVVASRPFAGSRYLAVHAAVAPGWSGRPVLDAGGALVGIVDLALLREPGTLLAVPIERAAARFRHGLRGVVPPVPDAEPRGTPGALLPGVPAPVAPGAVPAFPRSLLVPAGPP